MVWVVLLAALALIFLFMGRSTHGEAGIDRLRRLTGDEIGVPAPGRSRHSEWIRTLVEAPLHVIPGPLKELLASDLLEVVPMSGFTLERLTGIRITAMLGLPFIFTALARFSKTAMIMAPMLAVLGLMLPRIMAARNRNRYLETVRGCLPHMADMLYAFVLGGKNLDQAFRGAADASPEPLKSLLMQAVRELELGATREESFGRILDRCPLPELSSLLRSLTEAERRGYAVSSTMAVFSRELRLRRRDQLRVSVAKAPLKMLVPLVFLILPASVLLTVGPTFLVTLNKVL
jgi:tight adherence protein C